MSSPRERETRDRRDSTGDKKERQGRKRIRNESCNCNFRQLYCSSSVQTLRIISKHKNFVLNNLYRGYTPIRAQKSWQGTAFSYHIHRSSNVADFYADSRYLMLEEDYLGHFLYCIRKTSLVICVMLDHNSCKQTSQHYWMFLLWVRNDLNRFELAVLIKVFLDCHFFIKKSKRLPLETKNTLQTENGCLGLIETLHKRWRSLQPCLRPLAYTWAKLHFQRFHAW